MVGEPTGCGLMVIDASAAIDLLTESGDKHLVVAAIADHPLAAPQIFYLETIHACRRMLRTRQISQAAADRAID